MKQIKTVIVIAVIFLYYCDNDKLPPTCQDELDQICWPKYGTTRQSVELPVNTFTGYQLELKPGFDDSTLHFNIPLLGENVGRVDFDIFRDIKQAQLDLLNFYYAINSPFKPPRLTKEEFPIGDVAFGEENGEIFFVFFTRDNVRIIIDAPTNITKELAQKIDNIILNSPAWSYGDPEPIFVISEEFLQAFFSNAL